MLNSKTISIVYVFIILVIAVITNSYIPQYKNFLPINNILKLSSLKIPNLSNNNNNKPKCLYFTGAGVYFWWQAGAAKFIQDNYDVKDIPIIGASAGSLTSILLLCNCNFDQAADLALELANKEGVFDRKSGLYGILGPLLRKWLNELIPNTLTKEEISNLYIALTPIRKSPYLVNGFVDKEDVINACMASCHVPMFMDGKPLSEYRNEKVIDGSFWYFVTKDRYTGLPFKSNINIEDITWIDYGDDEVFMKSVSGNFLETTSPDNVYSMMKLGYDYMERKYEKKNVPSISSYNPYVVPISSAAAAAAFTEYMTDFLQSDLTRNINGLWQFN